MVNILVIGATHNLTIIDIVKYAYDDLNWSKTDYQLIEQSNAKLAPKESEK